MRRFRGRREVAIGLAVYAAYLAVRKAVWHERGRLAAHRNAERVVALERRLGIYVEPEIQRLVLARRGVVRILNVAYVTLNVGLTVGWLILLYRRRHPEFHRLRRAVALATAGALPVFLLFPTAPPRKLDDFTDTILEEGVDLERGLVVQLYNPIAALPSIHVAYAVVTADGIGTTARSRLLRLLAPLYPPAVALTVLVTANHYLLDAAAGWALGSAALRLARRLDRTRDPAATKGSRTDLRRATAPLLARLVRRARGGLPGAGP